MYIQNSTVRTSNNPAVGSGVAWSEAEPAEWQPELLEALYGLARERI